MPGASAEREVATAQRRGEDRPKRAHAVHTPHVCPDVLASIARLARQNGVERVILFGSRARGDNRERSDIDLAVTGGNVTSFALDVDEETPTLLMFDVVNLDAPVQAGLVREIARDGVVIYERTDADGQTAR